MDVHAPHQPVHTLKDFFIHLVIITLGLLIAVGIEGLVEQHREHKLVREARETLHDEIAFNLKQLHNAADSTEKQKAMLAADIKNLHQIDANPLDRSAQDAPISADFTLNSLRDTAWKTAQETGALSFMPYDESQKYSDIYELQQAFINQEDKIIEDEAHLMGVMAKNRLGKKNITASQAEEALAIFGQWQAHLLYLDLSVKISTATNQAFLDGKEGPHNMHESFQ